MKNMGILIAGIIAFAISVTTMPFYISWLKKVKAGQSIREEGPESHMIKAGTPTMGGLVIIIGTVIGSLVSAGFSEGVLIPLAALVLFGILGFLDDFVKVTMKRNLGLTAKQKLLLQILIALGLAFYSAKAKHGGYLWIPGTNTHFDMGMFYIPFIAFVVVAMVNSVNLTDGLDGLAGGTTAIVSAAFMIIGIMTGHLYTAGFMAAMLGAIIAFLGFNHYPAKIFMGDTGSLALGGGLAGCAVVMGNELLLPIAGGIFVIEALSVIIQVVFFKKTGKRVFKMAPIHHHFELSGWKETKVVSVFCFITLVLCVIAVFAGICNVI